MRKKGGGFFIHKKKAHIFRRCWSRGQTKAKDKDKAKRCRRSGPPNQTTPLCLLQVRGSTGHSEVSPGAGFAVKGLSGFILLPGSQPQSSTPNPTPTSRLSSQGPGWYLHRCFCNGLHQEIALWCLGRHRVHGQGEGRRQASASGCLIILAASVSVGFCNMILAMEGCAAIASAVPGSGPSVWCLLLTERTQARSISFAGLAICSFVWISPVGRSRESCKYLYI
jgi:hypothetical protein